MLSLSSVKRSLVILTLPACLSIGAHAEQPSTSAFDEFLIGPNVGWNSPIQAPVDLAWDAKTRRLHTRSLVLTETGDAVDLRIQRVPGGYPDGPVSSNQSHAGEVPGGIHWDALTPDGWRQTAGIEGVLGDQTGPNPTAASHPGWLTFYTYSRFHDDRLRRLIIDDTGAVSMGGGGYGSEGLPSPRYGLHLFGGGMRVQGVPSPDAPELSVVGGTGTTEYTYQVVGLDSKGNQTLPGHASTILGPGKLDGKNFVRLVWSRCPGAEAYWILRNGRRLDVEIHSEGNSKTFEDKGFPAVTYAPTTRNATADTEIDGSLTVRQAMYTPGVCTPPAIRGNVHNYAPAGLGDAATLILNPSAPR